jgi:hypothetical protein
VGPYITVTTAADAALGAHARGQWRAVASGRPRARPPPRAGLGTTTELLDGGALTLRGTRAPARGPAAAPPPSPPGRHGRCTLWPLRFFGAREEGGKRKGGRTPAALGQAVRVLAVAGERRPRAARTRRRQCREMQEREKCLGFSRGCWPNGPFIPAKPAGGRRIVTSRDGRSRSAGGWMGQLWPRRATRVGRFGGLPVGFWAAGPGGRAEAARGQLFPFRLKRKVVNSELCQFVLIFFRSNYLCF